MSNTLEKAVGSQVRTWARANGVTVGERGRFKPEVVKAFNEHPDNKGVRKYTEGNVKHIPLKVRVNGKSRTKTFPEAEVRAAAGAEAGRRGPLSSKALEAAAKALSS